MSKNKNEFTEQKSNQSNSLQVLLIPISIILAGMFIMVGVMVSATAVKSELESMRSQITAIQSLSASNAATAATPTPTPVIITKDQVKQLASGDYIKFGNTDSKVTFIEFSDPNCPYCHAAGGKNAELNKNPNFGNGAFKLINDGGTYVAPVVEMKKLVDEGKASFIWVYTHGHGNTNYGAQAFYCANEKGKFWEVHDLLMSNAGYKVLNNDDADSSYQVTPTQIAEFTKGIVDQSFMKDCLEKGKYADKLQRDQQKASEFEVKGTPGFFINTTRFPGAYSYRDMEATVKNELQ